MDENGNRTDQETVTTSGIQELIQAPAAQTITSQQEFSPEGARSPRPPWKRPMPKLTLVALLLCPAFVLIWGFFNGVGRPKHANTPRQKPTTADTSTQTRKEITRLQEENSDLKVGLALNDQAKLESELRRVQEQERQPQRRTEPPKPVASRSAPAPASTPRAIAQTPPAPRIQTAPVTRPAPIARSTSTPPDRAVDPMERWQELARLGSYGSISPDESPPQPEFSLSQFSDTAQATQRVRQAMLNAPYKVASTAIPTARIAPTSAVQSLPPEFAAAAPAPILEQPLSDEIAAVSDTLQTEESLNPAAPEVFPPILAEAEARILEASLEPQALVMGASSPGELITPIAIDEMGRSDRFTVKMNEALIGNQGKIAFPEGTEFVVQVDRVSETGQVHLSAIAATWSVNGQQQEITLPPNTIQIRGEAGEPLVAEHFEDWGDEIAGMDAGQFLLGAAGRAAQLYTRSGSRIQTRGSSTIITEENPTPDIVAGLVEGGTDAVLDSIQERNRRAIERMEEMPNIRYIDAGTDVEIFVNQSMFMPL
jgi:hypothetical protein